MRIKKVVLENHQPHSEDTLEITDENDNVYVLTGSMIEEKLVEMGDRCGECGDTGEVSTDESDGEGHMMHGVGTQKCLCQVEKEVEE